MFDKARVIIGTFALVNALVCLGEGLYSYSVGGIALFFAVFWIPEGLVMLIGAYSIFTSHYFIGGLLILAPSLFIGYVSWAGFLYALRLPVRISWELAFAIPILISAAAFLMHYRQWLVRQQNRPSTTQNQDTARAFVRIQSTTGRCCCSRNNKLARAKRRINLWIS